jgi:hypothetical protein
MPHFHEAKIPDRGADNGQKGSEIRKQLVDLTQEADL